jgi:sulfoxide reductase heme-binding subunit YedZ
VSTSDASIAAQPPRAASLAWLPPAVFVGALTPLAVFLYWGETGRLADPFSDVLNRVGLLALIMLVASLACTPIKLLTGWTWPLRLRRMLGLFAFFYALLHFCIYLRGQSGAKGGILGSVVADVIERPFIAVGFVALMLLTPLALTSTAKMVRRLGAKRWQTLHRLAYMAGMLGVVHFVMRVKADLREPLIYAGILILLFVIRRIVPPLREIRKAIHNKTD